MPKHRPSCSEFLALANGYSCAPVYRQLSADGLTPVSAYKRVEKPGASFLFESVVGGEKVGRFSFVGADPFLRFEAKGNEVSIARPADPSARMAFESADPFIDLGELLARYRSVQLPGLPRFAGGGAVGYAGYDSVRYTERLPKAPLDDRGLPDLAFAFHDRMLVFDHIRKTVMAAGTAFLDEAATAETAYKDACDRVDELVDRLSRPVEEIAPVDLDTDREPAMVARSNFDRGEFEAIVAQCQQFIKAGDVFQVVPSQRFEIETSADAFQIYRALRVVNPSPFLFLLGFEDHQLIGSSPEILVRYEDGEVTIRPLAGTRRRGRDEEEDKKLAAEMLADPKERAEHIMLVDLGRNDVGKVASQASVKISELMSVERYSHVMHISSNVSGRLLPGLSALDALRAGLPAGTVSGAPKVRAMEIINEVENRKRGPYGGAVGYIDFTGNMDTCIALRTIVKQGSKAYVQAGAGVVFDSKPAEEFEETVNKARGMIKAIEIAQDQLSPR